MNLMRINAKIYVLGSPSFFLSSAISFSLCCVDCSSALMAGGTKEPLGVPVVGRTPRKSVVILLLVGGVVEVPWEDGELMEGFLVRPSLLSVSSVISIIFFKYYSLIKNENLSRIGRSSFLAFPIHHIFCSSCPTL